MKLIYNFFRDIFCWIRGGCKISVNALYRLSVCFGCEFFDSKSKRCEKCGCRMDYKTKMDTARCPLKKW